jgi:hypothetical protein
MVTIDMAVTPYQVKDGKNVKGSITPIEGGFIAVLLHIQNLIFRGSKR